MYFEKSSFAKPKDNGINILACASCKSGRSNDKLKTLPCKQVVCETCFQEMAKSADLMIGEYKCKLCKQMHQSSPGTKRTSEPAGKTTNDASKADDTFKFTRFLNKPASATNGKEVRTDSTKEADHDGLNNYLPTKKSVTSKNDFSGLPYLFIL